MNNLSVIKEPIVKEMEVFDRLFDDSLTSDNALLDSVFGHLRSRKGKLMRPQLFMLTGKIFGDIDMRGMHAALALELLHTASLIHDDVVDNSDMRRGQASVNKMFDNKRAVLSGDYVLATALKHAAMSANIRVVNEISALGQALSEGEVMQLEKSMSEELSESVYMSVIERKTAASAYTTKRLDEADLFKGDKEFAVYSGNDDSALALMLVGGTGVTTYGENIGVMAANRVYSTLLFVIAACFAIILGFSPKFGAVIQTIPQPILGGTSIVVSGLIAVAGARIWVVNQVDFGKNRNLIVAAVTMILGGGDFSLTFFGFTFGGIGTATFGAIILNAIMSIGERR